MEHSNGAAVEAELEAAAQRAGLPRLIVSDQGSDLRKGIAGFPAAHSKIAAVPDAAHYGATVLEHAWSNQPGWQQFVKELQGAAAKLRQTAAAHLLPPRMRSKARFMNVHTQLRFARRVLQHLDGAKPCDKAVDSYGWLGDYRDDLAVWEREHGLVQTLLEQTRIDGLHAGTLSALKQTWGEVGACESTLGIVEQLSKYVTKHQPSKPGERYVASTEILESCFGRLKSLEGDQNQSGVTRLVLSLGATVGAHGEAELREALDATPEKHVEHWAASALGHTVQWLRKQLFREPQTVTEFA